jgi:nucleotide-binding universal stress UspA family protein
MYTHILVAVDGSGASQRALSEAIRLAKSQGGRIRLLHVIQGPLPVFHELAEREKGEFLESLRRSGQRILMAAEATVVKEGLIPESVMLESETGTPAELILEQAREWPASLVVLGTHPRSVDARVGYETRVILEKSPVPVLSVKADTAPAVTGLSEHAPSLRSSPAAQGGPPPNAVDSETRS